MLCVHVMQPIIKQRFQLQNFCCKITAQIWKSNLIKGLSAAAQELTIILFYKKSLPWTAIAQSESVTWHGRSVQLWIWTLKCVIDLPIHWRIVCQCNILPWKPNWMLLMYSGWFDHEMRRHWHSGLAGLWLSLPRYDVDWCPCSWKKETGCVCLK